MTRKCWLLMLCLFTAFATGCLSPDHPGANSPPPGGTYFLTDGFDFPVGDPDGRGWAVTGYDFLEWSGYSNSYHPGEDWNIPGAGNGDQGERIPCHGMPPVALSSISRNPRIVWSHTPI